MMKFSVVIFAVLVASQVSAKFPDYIKQCSLSDPHFNECLNKSANYALPHLLEGVPELNIPIISSYKAGVLDIDANEHIHFHSENGLTENSKYEIFDASFDPALKIIKFVIRTGHCEWTIDYVANGTILNKPILEKGNAKMIFDNADLQYEAQIVNKEIDGVKYYQIEKHSKADVTIEKFVFQSIDQESVNEAMSDDQRKIWETSLPNLKIAMAKRIETVGGPLVTLILNAVFKYVPKDEVFLA